MKKKKIVIVHVDFVHNVVSFGRSGRKPATFKPGHANMRRLTSVLNDLSYEIDGYSIRPHMTGFNAYRNG